MLQNLNRLIMEAQMKSPELSRLFNKFFVFVDSDRITISALKQDQRAINRLQRAIEEIISKSVDAGIPIVAELDFYSTELYSQKEIKKLLYGLGFLHNQGAGRDYSLPNNTFVYMPKTKGFSYDVDLEELEAKSIEEFGTTDIFNLAGYITPSGELLDFSEGQRTRTLDHTNIGTISDTLSRDDFIQLGFIRIGVNYLDIRTEPTSRQYDRIREFVEERDGSIDIDLEGKGISKFEQFDYENPSRVLGKIRSYYR